METGRVDVIMTVFRQQKLEAMALAHRWSAQEALFRLSCRVAIQASTACFGTDKIAKANAA